MEINERIKYLRKNLGLNQTDFARKIGMKQTGLSAIEKGKVPVLERNIKNICSEFHINEVWLRTGEGEMKCQVTTDERLRAWVNEVLSGRPDNIRYAFLSVMSNLDEEGWRRIAAFTEQVYLETHSTMPTVADHKKDTLQLANEIEESENQTEELFPSDGRNIV